MPQWEGAHIGSDCTTAKHRISGDWYELWKNGLTYLNVWSVSAQGGPFRGSRCDCSPPVGKNPQKTSIWDVKRHFQATLVKYQQHTTTHHNRLTALFPGPPGSDGTRRELLDFMNTFIRHKRQTQSNNKTIWCKGRSTEADTLTIWLGAIPSGLTSADLHHPHFLHAGRPSCRPTWIREKMLEFSSTVLPAPSLYLVKY